MPSSYASIFRRGQSVSGHVVRVKNSFVSDTSPKRIDREGLGKSLLVGRRETLGTRLGARLKPRMRMRRIHLCRLVASFGQDLRGLEFTLNKIKFARK